MMWGSELPQDLRLMYVHLAAPPSQQSGVSSGVRPFTWTLCVVIAFSALIAGCAEVVTHSSSSAPANAPTITSQPVNQTVTAGQSATFTVAASGTAPLSYQWQKNGANISGATSSSYSTAATTTSDNGSTYDVVVSNSAGTVTSNVATLTVNAAPAPAIQVSSSSFNFGNDVVGTTTSQTLTITNTGTAALNITQINKTGAAFSASGFTLPLNLSAGQLANITVAFLPTAVGAASGSLSIVSNAPTSPTSVSLSGTGVAGTLTLGVTPTSLAFGNVNVSGTSTPQTVTVTNTGNAQVSISSVATSQPFAVSGFSGSVTLNPNQSLPLTVVFAPTSAVSSTGALTITSTASSSPNSVSLTGTGVAQPAVPTITSQPVNQTVTAGQSATFTVAASGTAPLSYQWQKNGANISGATSSSYSTAATTTSDNGSTYDVVVSNSAGTVTSNVATLTVSAAPAPAIQVSSSSLNFGNDVVGTATSQTLTITNTGTAALNITQINKTGAAFSASGFTLPLNLSAGQLANITVAFLPTAVGAASGSLSIVSNAPTSPTSIPLSGTGVAATYSLVASPTSLNFGNVNDGSSSTLGVTLTNSGNSNVTISSVTLSGAGFSASGVSAGTILTPNQTATLNVLFAPTAAGSVSGSVTVTSNATNSPAVLSLSGAGVTPSGLDLTPPVCGLVNDAKAHVPNATTWANFTPPPVGGTYGTTGDDAVFGCTVTRLTNASTDGLGAGEVQYYSTDSIMSAGDSYVSIFDQNGNWHIVASGATIGNPTYVGHPGQAVVSVANFPSQNKSEPVWDVTTDNKFWITRGNSLYSCLINGTNSTTCTLDHTFSEYSYYVSIPNMANMTPGGWISMAGQNVQGSSMDFFLYNPSTSSKSPVYTPSSCTANLATSVQPGCVHGMTPFIGEYLLVDNNNAGNVWVYSGGSPNAIPSSDHLDLGYDLSGNIVAAFEDYSASGAPGGNGPFGACTNSFRPTVVTYSSSGIPSTWGCMFDLPTENGFHVSYQDGTVRPWVVYSMQGSNGNCSGCTWGYFNSSSGYTAPSSNNWEPYVNEIDMIRIDANNDSSKIYRLALTHTRAYDPNGGYWADPRANVSKDGKYIIFTSNSPYASSGCGSLPAPCTDVFMLSAPNQTPLF